MWTIQEIISQHATHTTCWVTHDALHSNSAGQPCWGKLYTGDKSWPEFEYFCRQASLSYLVRAPGLVPLIESILDHSDQPPLLVYPRWDATPIAKWLLECSQLPAQSMLVWLMRQAVEALSAIHQSGMVHGQVDANHIMIANSDQSVRLVGLGSLEIIGTMSSLPRYATRFDAPERMAAEFEVSTAADIYSMGVLMLDTLGNSLETSPIIQAMLADDPCHRPAASEITLLLRELEQSLFGATIAPAPHRPNTSVSSVAPQLVPVVRQRNAS